MTLCMIKQCTKEDAFEQVKFYVQRIQAIDMNISRLAGIIGKLNIEKEQLEWKLHYLNPEQIELARDMYKKKVID